MKIKSLKENTYGQIIDNGDWKSFDQIVKFNDIEQVRLRLSFNKETGKGVIRACSFFEIYPDEWKNKSKTILFNDKITSEFNLAEFVNNRR